MEKRLKVLMSAYACEPDRGSEPEVGWRWALEMAKHHDITVITRANNQRVIEAGLAQVPEPHPQFVYHDLPSWARSWKRMPLGVQLYYVLWQRGILKLGRQLLQRQHFDLSHHVTFGKCTAPSPLAKLPIPLIFGPVGGAESTPRGFRRSYGLKGQLFELARDAARHGALLTPNTRSLFRHTHAVLAATPQTAEWIRPVCRHPVRLESQCGMAEGDLRHFESFPIRENGPVRFLSMARLVHWKGIHLALRAFARLAQRVPDSQYWIVSGGPEESGLRRLATELGVASQVTFWGRLPSLHAVHDKLIQADALVHPALHEAFGYACLEALAAGRPVICLDWGGPAMQVTPECGVAVRVDTPAQVVGDLSGAMEQLARQPRLRCDMAAAARRRVKEEFHWNTKASRMDRVYEEVATEWRQQPSVR